VTRVHTGHKSITHPVAGYNYAQQQIQTSAENKWYQKCVNYEAAVIVKHVTWKCNGSL
jgi:hypothetical protein